MRKQTQTSRVKLVAFAIALVLAGCAAAADKQVDGLLGHMRDAYKNVKSATYTTSTTYQDKDQGEQTFTCDFAYMKPDLIRVLMKGTPFQDATVTLVSNGKQITISAPQGTAPQQDYSVKNLEQDLGPMANLESLCFWDWEQQLSTAAGKNMEHSTFKIVKDEPWNGKHWLVLEETAKKDNVLCRYFIDPKTYFIWRTTVSDLDTGKQRMDCKITKLNPNASLDEAMFKGS